MDTAAVDKSESRKLPKRRRRNDDLDLATSSTHVSLQAVRINFWESYSVVFHLSLLNGDLTWPTNVVIMNELPDC